jgi:hypothetical protein
VPAVVFLPVHRLVDVRADGLVLERVRAALPPAAGRRLADPNVTDDERRVRRLVRRAVPGTAA